MKFCPVCQTRYDEEILRFCTKDGTPLVDENPSFTEMPSEGKAEDIGEETLISMGRPKSVPLPPPDQPNFEEEPGQRIVIPTSEPEKEAVRAKPLPPPPPQQQSSNTVWIVLATMFGTFTILAVLGGVWYFLSNRNGTDSNKNTNVNTAAPNTNYNINLNTNSSSPTNFNFNANVNENVNANTNVNANLKSPTPTKTPTPTPSPTPEEANVNSNSNSGNSNISPRPSTTPTPSQSVTPTPTPRTSPTPTATPTQNVNVGIMNSRAVSLTKPAYPQAAKQANASGEVRVQVSVDEGGNVTSARAISGHALLRNAAENAARQSRFNPIRIGDQTVSATGIVVYNFINQ